MKKILVILVLQYCTSSVKSQVFNSSAITKTLDSITQQINSDPEQLISYRSLNKFFAKKVAYYLSGSSDLSLFTNYAVLDFGEDKATIGWNINASKKSSNRVSDVVTISLQSAVMKNFAILFADKNLNNDLGLNLKYTKIFKGSAWFDNKKQTQRIQAAGVPLTTQKAKMNLKRKLIVAEINIELIKLAFHNVLYFQNLSRLEIPDSLIEQEKEARFKILKTEAIDKYYARELEEMENEDNAVYKKAFSQWISFKSFIPITKSTFTGTADITKTPSELVSRKWMFGASYSAIYESKRNKLFINGSAEIVKSNSIDASLIDEVSIDKFKLLSQNLDTSVFEKVNSESIYLGNYEEFWTPSITAQVVFYPQFSKNVGIDLSFIKKFGKDQAFDFILGLPITLTSQDGDSPFNIILQAKFRDINNKILPEKSISDKLQIGFKVGLPFNNIMK